MVVTNMTGTTNGSLDVWGVWNVTYANTAATSLTVNGTNTTIWTLWNQAYTSTSITATGGTDVIYMTVNQAHVWTNWNESLTARERAAAQQAAAGRRPSQEELDRWKRQEEEQRRKADEAAREARAAKERAEVLLLRHLSPQQQEDLRTKNCFTVEVDGCKYRIQRGSHGNVHMLGERADQIRKSFCIQPRDCPEGDAMLAQKLMLEHDAEKFWKIANVTHHDGKSVPKKDNVLEFRRLHKKAEAAA